MTGQQTEEGRFLTDADVFYRANVAVLGFQAAEKLFPYGDPVGKTVRVGEDHYFRIVGVTSYKAPSSGTGSSLAAQDFNRDIYIPLTTDRRGLARSSRARSRAASRPRRSSSRR